MNSSPSRAPVWIRRVGMLLLLLAGWVGAQAQIEDSLKGVWTMEDETPSLMHPSNAERFSIQRVTAGESQWADGVFVLRWPSSVQPERGYFSNKNGRVWITTYRYVDNERVRVEYRGEIKRAVGKITWEGTAMVTTGKRTTWEFVATREE
ncbi:hypothetical protein [Actomonas aquatica]|uniref:Lipocalin-like domain-containing protein n=1 Tax=Actomonas aquatica TaxID=2866162 RepID=A0ABZ1CDS9_9BACT|nr:hypothetical protein [Opitutus sp. WL0086]WRQ89766.1 hypothetical protein K1X11_010145 [Opitutus sp. WL0086]